MTVHRAFRRAALPFTILAVTSCGGNDRQAREPPDSVPPAPAGDCATPLPGSAGGRVVRVFFTCGERLIPLERVVEGDSVLAASLEQLLRGPTPAERAAGYHSFFSLETAGMLRSVELDADGVAHISFDDFSGVIPNASSSAGSEQLLDQLRATIFQFPSVRSARIDFGGDCDAFWNWLQRDCQPLLPE